MREQDSKTTATFGVWKVAQLRLIGVTKFFGDVQPQPGAIDGIRFERLEQGGNQVRVNTAAKVDNMQIGAL